jgi:hypothetical protein
MLANCLLVLDGLKQLLTNNRYTIFDCHQVRGILEPEARLSEAWGEFELLTSHEWSEIRTSIDQHLAGMLLVYGMRMATLSVREGNPIRVSHGLMALVLDQDLLDQRDVLCDAALLYDASTRLNVSPEALFRRSANYASSQRSSLLLQYLTAPDYMKSAESMGFDVVTTEEGFTYKHRPW